MEEAEFTDFLNANKPSEEMAENIQRLEVNPEPKPQKSVHKQVRSSQQMPLNNSHAANLTHNYDLPKQYSRQVQKQPFRQSIQPRRDQPHREINKVIEEERFHAIESRPTTAHGSDMKRYIGIDAAKQKQKS